MKELKEEQLVNVSGGKIKRYHEPDQEELAEINRITEELKKTLDGMHKASPDKIEELRRKYGDLVNELLQYVRVRQIDPKYSRYWER